jgi:methylglyoxal synthase
MSFSQKHNNIFNNVKLLHVSVTGNHHQADISVHVHDMFSPYSMGSHTVYICCVEFQTFRLINYSIFNILTNAFSEIIYETINVGLSVKI